MIDLLLMCLALTVYHEARGEPIEGQRAVAHVVMNRVSDPRWPGDVCRVTRQRDQFSWLGRVNPLPGDEFAWRVAVRVSHRVLVHRSTDTTGRATHYHNTSVAPRWARTMTITKRIGRHVFYRTD